ncbi:hypothetical protein BKP35_11800 [Anaerobacillus arseniciselenatis]|uniref:DUF6449 domain-containing protein n=1 Tax=Anaerobacillus arseniciselenatis TaxID=85682 RepID=A0A1S2LIU9_9BACI|nr:DUF6449 domain-containing protein [Anaerobacillus arseniciselenatis]OIJ11617.1 hypothetical protein BKP35_11800 [Anaerobacillus arseniciselenatis]
MRLKTLLFNQGIFVQNVRSVGWIFIAYLLCLLFAVPLRILMVTSSRDDYLRMYEFTGETLFRFSSGFQMILMFTVPVLLGIFIFRYLQVKLSADYIHSLPIKREALYQQNVIFGLGVVVIPVLITGLILLILSSFVDAPNVLNIGTIAAWVATTIVVNVFVFMATVFVAMFTGISVFQGVLTYILLVFPAGVTVLFFMNVNYFLRGFAVDYYLDHQVERWLPFVRVGELTHTPFSGGDFLGFFIIAIAFYLVALFVYQRRKVEMASQAVAFRVLRPVFLYGVTFCAMLLGGMYFGQTQGTFGWRLFGYIVASLIGYVVAQMILEKTWRVLGKWKGYGVFVVAMAILALLIKFDVTGYENRVPVAENVERVYLSDSAHWLSTRRPLSEHEEAIYRQQHFYEDRENIDRIINLHEEVIAGERSYDQNRRFYRQAVFYYELTNGRKLVRAFQVPVEFYTKPNEPLAKLMESEEYKYNYFPVLRLENTDEINHIRISSNRGGHREIIITDATEIKEFHQLLQKDIKEMTHDEFTDGKSWAWIEYSLISDDRRNYLNADWKKSYEKIEAWLEARDLARQARFTAEDIAFAVVGKREAEMIETGRVDVGEDFKDREGTIRIEDVEELKELLDKSSMVWNDEGKYVIAYYYEDDLNRPHFETISAEHVPDSILQQLNER